MINTFKHCFVTKQVDVVLSGQTVSDMFERTKCFTMFDQMFIAPFNNKRTLKFKAQRTNPFFATVNQMSGGSSQLPTSAEDAVIKSLSTV